ncbi:Detected protein of confused Function [Hibiscus syriacus]|uniref:Tafazzin family protein n=1 Tax=Hibiscus syriacus TaxID=106335 RepID=A0A6A3AP94_HIBSY|nr:Detected protein of confused Function [Hibiscus syriacus]
MDVQRLDRGDLWKNKVRFLQLQLRQRFREAVDRIAILSSLTVTSPSRFNAGSVASPCFMNGLNRVQVYGLENLHDALLNRPKNKPLITVSNHVASVDDPFVIAALFPPRVLINSQNLRWILCASDRCFSNPVTSAFFRSVKVLPVSRGDGIYQMVTVLIGDPILFDDLLNVEDASDASRGKLYDAVASRIGIQLQNLKVKVDKLALEQSIQSENLNKDGAERAASILHQVDWDPFGLGSHGYADESSVEKTQVETKLSDISPEEAT